MSDISVRSNPGPAADWAVTTDYAQREIRAIAHRLLTLDQPDPRCAR